MFSTPVKHIRRQSNVRVGQEMKDEMNEEMNVQLEEFVQNQSQHLQRLEDVYRIEQNQRLKLDVMDHLWLYKTNNYID